MIECPVQLYVHCMRRRDDRDRQEQVRGRPYECALLMCVSTG
jgi:hypothetical protein